MGKFIEPVNLEGLSEEGRLMLKKNTYKEYKKSTSLAFLLLLAGGLVAAHRFYLGDVKFAWGIIAIITFILIISILMEIFLIFQFSIFILFVIELFLLSSRVTAANTYLEKQLNEQIFPLG